MDQRASASAKEGRGQGRGARERRARAHTHTHTSCVRDTAPGLLRGSGRAEHLTGPHCECAALRADRRPPPAPGGPSARAHARTHARTRSRCAGAWPPLSLTPPAVLRGAASAAARGSRHRLLDWRRRCRTPAARPAEAAARARNASRQLRWQRRAARTRARRPSPPSWGPPRPARHPLSAARQATDRQRPRARARAPAAAAGAPRAASSQECALPHAVLRARARARAGRQAGRAGTASAVLQAVRRLCVTVWWDRSWQNEPVGRQAIGARLPEQAARLPLAHRPRHGRPRTPSAVVCRAVPRRAVPWVSVSYRYREAGGGGESKCGARDGAGKG